MTIQLSFKMKSFALFLFLLLVFYSCKNEERKEPNIAQLVYVSDLHYGYSRTFRGVDSVDASAVNQAMVKQINELSTFILPQDSGVAAGQKIGGVDYVVVTGDISSRQEIPLQSASASWSQFSKDYFNGITLKKTNGEKTNFLLTCGNHDVSNAIGFHRPMKPSVDAFAMVSIYNFVFSPTVPKTTVTYNYHTDKINYSKDIVGVHCMFVNMWPDSANRVWMEKDLAKVNSTTPVIVFTHDQPDCEAKHFTNPNGNHSINSTDKFDNLLEEQLKDGTTTNVLALIEQRNFVKFLKLHPNIKAYFHGNENKNQYYCYQGPDKDIKLNVFRVDSPLKGNISGSNETSHVGDETKLSFQMISIDGNAKKLTVRECLWNTNGKDSKMKMGESMTISLK